MFLISNDVFFTIKLPLGHKYTMSQDRILDTFVGCLLILQWLAKCSSFIHSVNKCLYFVYITVFYRPSSQYIHNFFFSYNSSIKIELQHNSSNGHLSGNMFRYWAELIINSTFSFSLFVQLFNIHTYTLYCFHTSSCVTEGQNEMGLSHCQLSGNQAALLLSITSLHHTHQYVTFRPCHS
jgi:hypothetical protein